MQKSMKIISNNIQQAIEILDQDDIVAIPTETVYWLAGNIYSEKAIRKIFEIKQRPFFNPLIVHIHSLKQLETLVSHVPPLAKLLAETFWPWPLTLVMKKQPHIPDLITAGKDGVAVRMPNHPLTLNLLKELSYPLAAPSANPFGRISPTRAAHVDEYFDDSLRMILDGGDCTNGIESTIIGFEDDTPVLYRLGAVSLEDIEKVIGQVTIKNKEETSPNAPGMLERHYAPRTKTYLTEDVVKFTESFPGKKIGVLQFIWNIEVPNVTHREILSATWDLHEAASKLYTALHNLDVLWLDIIIAEKMPDVGLGKSINDRLERATKNI